MSEKAPANTVADKNNDGSGNNMGSNMKDEKKSGGMTQGGFKFLLLCLMVAQNSSVVLVSRYLKSHYPKEDQVNVNHLVCVTEIGKLIGSCLLEFYFTNGGLFRSFKENVLDAPLDALKISVPALLYLIQNTLLYVALGNLAAPLFQVTYQGKLVTTAIVSVIMLGRRYNPKQWVCLVALSVGVAVVVLGEKKDGDDKGNTTAAAVAEAENGQSLILGLLCVTISCCCSALAGVYFEKVLKKKTTDNSGVSKAPVSMWMRNIQLATFSIIIAVLQGIMSPVDGEPKPYLHGFNACAWVVVLLQAGGGLLVAAVIKYADNVLKGLATGVSVVVATLGSWVVFSTPLTFQFTAGAAVILTSVYFFNNDLPMFLRKKENGNGGVEMQAMLPR